MKDKLRMIIFVMILGAIASGILTSMNIITAERIKKNEELKEMETILKSFAMEFEKEDVEAVYEENIEEFKKDGVTFYKTKDNAVGFEFYGPGLWGDISGYISLEADLETIKGIEILSQSETPGLGGVIAEKDYLEQFKGKKVVPNLEILKGVHENKAENEVDGVTGATMTSDLFQELLNIDIQDHKEKLVN